MEDLIGRGQRLGASAPVLLTAPEAERIIESLRCYPLDDVGTSKWLEQQGWIEKLNLQGHHNAQSHADEFVKDLLISYDKISTIIHELLVAEVWKDKLLPFLKKHLAKKVDSVTTYLLLFHEANLANLLEIVLFHEQSIEAIDEEHLLELVDWCHRQLQYLNTEAYRDAAPAELSAQALMNQTPLTELEEKLREVRFGVGMCSLSITRYLTDHVGQLPMGIVSRLLQTNDTLMALLPLTDSPPWERKRKGHLERYEDNAWRVVAAGDRFKLSTSHAQVWLALNNLLVDPKCRAKYDMDDFRKESVLRLKRFMSDLLFDQLPVLKDLQRALDELSLNCNPNMAAFSKSRLILEQVATIRDGLLRRDDWEALAKRVKKVNFGPASRGLAEDRMKSLLQAFEFMAEMMPAVGEADASAPCVAKQPPVRVSVYRRVGGIMQPTFVLEFPVNHDEAPVPIELQGGGGVVVRGQRWKLHVRDTDSAQTLPTKGRVAACHGDRSAEALLELPAPSTKSAESLAAIPAGMWLTVGLLATDGFALQLKLKRTDKPTDRDRGEGVWHVYHVVGGAITVLLDTVQSAVPLSTVEPYARRGPSLMELD